ncbi:hypothetical protein DYB30_003397 [Aphanomyces astaci]|nr:hypothetical protein DYB30_003397 [Aphanomyces astaci]
MKKPNQQLKQPPTKSQQSHGDWHCEPCEKHFAMKSQFDAHVLTHEACWAPGCDFSASKRVVTSHHQTAHGQYAGSGLKEIEVEGQKFHGPSLSSIPCKQFVAKGTCKRGDECNFAHTGALSTAQDKAKQQYLKLQATQVKEHKSSLLRKLLAKDIDKEHRHILQSFRYLVEHQFFQPTPDDDVEVLE